MESQHSIGAPTSRDCPRFVIISQISRPEVGSRSRCYQKTCAFGKKTTPCGKILKISSRKDSPPRIHVLCANFVKFGRPEIGKVVRYLPDRAQNLPGPAANNAAQTSSKSVHFRRSYSRTREHHSNAPQSVSNTRRSFSFFAE